MYHEECANNEIFVGNVEFERVEEETNKLNVAKVKYRFGTVAYDINGKKIKNVKPLFIDYGSIGKYDRMKMNELKEIRNGAAV